VAPASFAQVKFFDRPPTVEEAAAALSAQPSNKGMRSADSVRVVEGDPGSAPIVLRTRGIERITAATPTPSQTIEQAGTTATRPTKPVAGPAIALPVNFNRGSTRMTAASTPYIEAMINLLAKDPTLSLIVEGHTDAVGNSRTNMLLSWQRALETYRVMVERYGVDPQRLQPVGRGSTEPLPYKDPLDGANRRIQFRVAG